MKHCVPQLMRNDDPLDNSRQVAVDGNRAYPLALKVETFDGVGVCSERLIEQFDTHICAQAKRIRLTVLSLQRLNCLAHICL